MAALTGPCQFKGDTLPDPLPVEPFGLVTMWLSDASAAKTQPNPNAMTVATVGSDGRPSARVVLCRGVDAEGGSVVFYTNYTSRKGEEADGKRVAAVFHWDHLERQVRIEGVAMRVSEAESDAYFASRPKGSRIAAWASDQSRPIARRQELLDRQAEFERRFGVRAGVDVERDPGVVVPRPPHWGGFRVFAESVELWLGHPQRLHDRAEWKRTLTLATVRGVPGMVGGVWSLTRLMP